MIVCILHGIDSDPVKGKDTNDEDIVADWEAFLFAQVEPDDDDDDDDYDDYDDDDNLEYDEYSTQGVQQWFAPSADIC